MSKDSLESSMVKSMRSSDLGNLAVNTAEIALDSILSDGIARDIPIIGALVGAYNFTNTVRERIFAKKVLGFLSSIESSSNDERIELIDQLEEEKGSKERAGASVLMLLDRLDDLTKPELVGKLFVACAKKRISADDLFRLCSYIERLYINDVKALAKYGSGEPFEYEEKDAYITVGLMTPKLRIPYRADVGNIHGFEEHKDPELRHEFTRHAKILALELFDAKPKGLTVRRSE